MKRKYIILPLLLFFISAGCYAKRIDLRSKGVKEHMEFLASDSLKGRFPGTPESIVAAQYIRNQLQQYGYTPLCDAGFQPFNLTIAQRLGEGNSLAVNGEEMTLGTDYTVLSISENSSVQATVCFAGYGFSISEGDAHRDDYTNLSVQGKWVMVLLDAPTDQLLSQARYQTKAVVAREKGAAGVLFVAPQGSEYATDLMPFFAREAGVGIPCLQMSRQLADRLLAERNTTLETVEKNLSNPHNIINFELEAVVAANVAIERSDVTTANVVMLLKGSNPALQHESIVLGAHYDHLGYGGAGSGSRTPQRHEIHNGADDNASGVSLLLALAKQLATHRQQLGRSIVIVAFGAEEQGIVGSKYFVNNTPAEVGKVVAMLNFDMVGRLNEKRTLQVNGVGTFAEAEELVKAANSQANLALVTSKSGFGPSDHAPFYAKQIPVLYFTTGVHTDYHTPDDVLKKINITGIEEVCSLAAPLTERLANLPQAPAYLQTGGSEMHSSPTKAFKVTLGIIPDFTSNESNGMRADVVSEGRPAYKAGMKNGDLIISINQKAVSNIQDYMLRLAELKKGETAEVLVMRNGEQVTLHVEL